MKTLFKVLSYMATVFLVVYFVFYIIDTFDAQDFSAFNEPIVIIAIFVASLLYALIIPFSALAWHLLLKSHDQDKPISLLASIMGVTQFVKYVPGNVAQHISRVTLSLAQGIKFKSLVSTLLIESSLTIIASLAVGGILLLFSPESFQRLLSIIPSITWGKASYITISILITIVIFLIISWKRTVIRSYLRKYNVKSKINIFLLVFFIYSVNYLMIGLGMWLLGIFMDIKTEISYSSITAAFALSWLAGFITLGAPAGIGVREAALVFLLSTPTIESQILSFILAMRLSTLIGDSLCFIFGTYGMTRLSNENNN